jgi:hypothetical protein
MGNLEQYPGTITGLVIRAFRAPVLNPFKNFQTLFYNRMGWAAFDIRYKPYATRVMLILFAIKTSRDTLVSPFFILAHDGSFNIVKLLDSAF